MRLPFVASNIGPLVADRGALFFAAKNDSGREELRTGYLGSDDVLVLAEAGERGIFDLAVDATHVYWLECWGRGVLRIPRTGGEIEIVADPKDVVRPYRCFLEPGALWVAAKGNSSGHGRGVSRIEIPSGTIGYVKTREPCAITLDETHVFVALENLLVRLPRQGGPPEAIGEIKENLGSLARHDDDLWVEGGQRLFRVPLGGGEVERLEDVKAERVCAAHGCVYYARAEGGVGWIYDEGTRGVLKPSVDERSTYVAADASHVFAITKSGAIEAWNR